MLSQLIREHALASAQASDWAAVAAILNAQTVEVRNAKSWTMADLITLLGAESAAVVGGTIQAAGASNPIFAGAWLALNITGLQLHTDERQTMIAGLADAAGWPSELKAAALSAGLTYTSLSDATAADCQRAWIIASCIDPIRTTHSAAAAKLNNAQASLGPEHTDGLTLVELQDWCDAITASVTGEVLNTRVTTTNNSSTGNYNVTAAASGLLVVVAMGSVVTTNQVPSGMTLGGVAMTSAIATSSGPVACPCRIAYAVVSAGTHTLNFGWSGTLRNHIVRAYLLEGLSSSTPVSTTVTSSSGTSANLVLSAGSVGIFAVVARSNTTNTWSEGTNYDNVLETTDTYSFGFAESISANPVVATLGTTATFSAIGASWSLPSTQTQRRRSAQRSIRSTF